MFEDHEQLKSYITNYYKGLFGAPKEVIFSLDESQIDDIPRFQMRKIAYQLHLIQRKMQKNGFPNGTQQSP
jgi:hypothetical protein